MMPQTMGAAELTNMDDLREAADKASRLLKVLANPDRLVLLCALCEGEQCVSELEAVTGVKQPTLSQQLTVLREERLVATRREGKQIFYRVGAEEALAVMQVLYGLCCGKDKAFDGEKT